MRAYFSYIKIKMTILQLKEMLLNISLIKRKQNVIFLRYLYILKDCDFSFYSAKGWRTGRYSKQEYDAQDGIPSKSMTYRTVFQARGWHTGRYSKQEDDAQDGIPSKRMTHRTVFQARGWRTGRYSKQEDDAQDGIPSKRMTHRTVFQARGWHTGRYSKQEDDAQDGIPSKRMTHRTVFQARGWHTGRYSKQEDDAQDGIPSKRMTHRTVFQANTSYLKANVASSGREEVNKLHQEALDTTAFSNAVLVAWTLFYETYIHRKYRSISHATVDCNYIKSSVVNYVIW